MNFFIDWTDGAVSGLTSAWLVASDRAAVNASQMRIDQLLAADPAAHGLHVSEELYAIEAYPLRALFEISEADAVVTIVSVGLLP